MSRLNFVDISVIEMILKELFEKVGFDAMVPGLTRLYERQTRHSQTGYFKMAYDEMMHTAPVMEGYSIGVNKVSPKDGEGPSLVVENLEGWPWDECLGYELEIDEGLEDSEVEMAVQFMWGMTFYRYSRVFGSAEDYIQGKPPRSTKSILQSALLRCGLRWNKSWSSLWTDNKFVQDEFHSLFRGEQQRIDYLTGIVEKYMGSFYSPATIMILFVDTQAGEPLTDEERQQLKDCAVRVCGESVEVNIYDSSKNPVPGDTEICVFAGQPVHI